MLYIDRIYPSSAFIFKYKNENNEYISAGRYFTVQNESDEKRESPDLKLKKRKKKVETENDGNECIHKKRSNLTPAQTKILSEFFSKNRYPDSSEKLLLARETGIDTKKVSNWFTNRRMRDGNARMEKKKQISQKQIVVENVAQA